ncbi:MAG: general secretion pathway protein GspB [Acidobacteriota bacterium]
MSYILDALKKAERERGIAKVPTLETIHSSSEKSRRTFWGIATAVLVLIAVSVGLFFILGEDSVQPIVDSAVSPRGSQTGKLSDTEEPGIGIQAGQSDVQIRDKDPYAPPGNDSKYETGRTTAADSGPEKEVAANPGAGISEASNAVIEARAPITSSALQNSRKISADPGAPSSKVDDSDSGFSRASVLKDAIDSMEVSIHMYSQTPSKRLIFINGRKYVEGDFVNGSFRIEAITREGAILSYEGEQASLKAGM